MRAPAIDSSLVVSVCPSGQVAGSLEAIIGRFSVKVVPHERHRNSYVGMARRVDGREPWCAAVMSSTPPLAPAGASERRPGVPTVTVSQMREVDRLMTDEAGIALVQMMENAGRALARVAVNEAGGSARGLRVAVLAGSGGNGGGGLAAARRLACWGARVAAWVTRADLHGVPAQQRAAAEACGVHVLAGPPGEADLDGTQVVIDAVLGYSLAGVPRGAALALITSVQRAHGRGVPVVSLDVPSGMDPDSGRAPGAAVTASHTVTLALPKPGLLTDEGAARSGALTLADISVPSWIYSRLGVDAGELFTTSDLVRLR